MMRKSLLLLPLLFAAPVAAQDPVSPRRHDELHQSGVNVFVREALRVLRPGGRLGLVPTDFDPRAAAKADVGRIGAFYEHEDGGRITRFDGDDARYVMVHELVHTAWNWATRQFEVPLDGTAGEIDSITAGVAAVLTQGHRLIALGVIAVGATVVEALGLRSAREAPRRHAHRRCGD